MRSGTYGRIGGRLQWGIVMPSKMVDAIRVARLFAEGIGELRGGWSWYEG